jgi:hypothetical protein
MPRSLAHRVQRKVFFPVPDGEVPAPLAGADGLGYVNRRGLSRKVSLQSTRELTGSLNAALAHFRGG